MLHLVAEKLLFIMNGFRPGLETAKGFLTAIVLKSDIGEWGKIRKICYGLLIAPSKKKYFGATSIDKIFTWVDA